MNRAEKSEIVESLNKTFTESTSVIVLSFKGVDVPDITNLRNRVRDTASSYLVVKNTLAMRAAEGTPLDQVKDHFVGPTAVAYTADDPVALVKVLKDFSKDNPGFLFKTGVLRGQVLSEEQVSGLAEMPPRDELLAKFLFLMNAPLTRLARGLKSPVRDLAVVLTQLAEKKEE